MAQQDEHRADAGVRPEAEAREAGATAASDATQLPDDVLIILPVRRMVLFPGAVVPIAIGRPGSIAAVQAAANADRPIGVVMQREAETAQPRPENLHSIGTLARILRYVTTPDGGHHVVAGGEHRIRITEYLFGHPYLAARYEPITEPETKSPEIDARFLTLKDRALAALELLPAAPQELVIAVTQAEDPGRLADLVAQTLDLESNEKQEVLQTVDLVQRLDRVLDLLNYRIEVLKVSRDIGRQTQERLSEQQREHVLRQQLREIQKQLGEDGGAAAEISRLKEDIEKAGMPEEAKRHALKEVARLERIPEASVEHGMLRTYLETMVELPWAEPEPKEIDIAEARAILDADHFGLNKIKKRILEHLAVRKLNPSGKSPILCFVGPPGVGKTSLGQSIARAMGRKFARLSLGGVHDEAEIRGHRMTYVGAMPGNIIQVIRRTGARDCVLMLDEMDKLGQSFRGDPASALLEVLDPEQNSTFRDNYLGVPFDLSRVVFIATANVLDAIPGPLRDRMEVIELPGYTEEEKLEIAKRYLVARQLEANGLKPEQAEITDAALSEIIRRYTREAGVRNLERTIGSVLRHVAVKIAEGEVERQRVDVDDLGQILGSPKFENEIAMRTSVPGVATGLAWTPFGGDILFIEAARAPGSGKLILTGQLGDVMKESAQAALSLVKTRAGELGVDPALFEKNDIHVHVPAGAIPKDGPSAGVAMFVALASLATGKCARSDVAMTGEISLRGLVLPVGGIKEKATAAARAGLKTVLLPARNKKDLEEIPESARKQLEFVWLETVDDAMAAAMKDAKCEEVAAPP